MKLTHAAFVVPMLMVALAGCVGEASDEEALGVGQEAALSLNSLSENALSLNALSLNALSLNALSLNALSLNALSSQNLTGIQDPTSIGDLSRQLLKYTVGCALNASQSFSFSWTDALGAVHHETYAGQLGLAPDWAGGALTDVGEQEWVSACLAARTNYFGVTVHISVRGTADALVENTTNSELAAYPYVEGAFWGNLFTSSPYLASCYNAANAAHSEADQRVCATGYLDSTGRVEPCGMITLTGPCDQTCSPLNGPHQLYPSCAGYQNVITIGLE